MSRSRLAALLALVLTVAAVRAQAPPPPPPPPPAKVAPAPAVAENPEAVAIDGQLIAEVKERAEVMPNLTHLSDEIGPRLTGSENLKRANEWTAEKMKSYGLSNVHLEPWTIPAGWERGTVAARLLEPDNGRTITAAAAGWSPGTKGKVEGDVVVVRAQNKDELAKYKGKLKNAIVLRSPPARVLPITDPTYRAPGGGPPAGANGRPSNRNGAPPAAPMGDPAAFYRQRTAFFTEMNEFLRAEGAAVILTDSGKPHGLLNMSGGWRSTERANAGEPLPMLYVTHDHYALLWRLASRPEPARTRMEVEISNKFVPGPVTVYNTVGEIRGSEKPDEFVVLGAHLDSWDLGQGTTDNGTGSCVVLEAARAIMKSGVRPKRTIRFVLFTGEEQGLYGSKAYVNAHKDELARTSLAVVHDTGTGRVVGIGTQRRETLKPIFERELGSLTALGVKGINNGSVYGSDHQSFDGAGVPGICFQQDPAEYRFTHHSQSDTLDKARAEDLVQGAQVMAVVAVRFANLDSLLPHHEAAPSRRAAAGQ